MTEGDDVNDRNSATRKRELGVLLSALAFGAYLFLAAVPAHAAVSCSYDAVNRQVNIDLTANGDAVTFGVGTGGAIVFDDDQTFTGATQCGTATVNNTDGIDVDDDSAGGVVVRISLAGGPLAPGETPENTGTSEIEI